MYRKIFEQYAKMANDSNIFFASCSLSESDIINVTVNNASNDDLVVSFVPSSKIEGISAIGDLNEKSVASSKILS